MHGGALLFLGGKDYNGCSYEKRHSYKAPELVEGPTLDHLSIDGVLRPLGLWRFFVGKWQ